MQPTDIYSLSNHLTPQQTQEALALAAVLGVIGFLLAQQHILQSIFTAATRPRNVHTPASVLFAPGRE